MIISLFEDLPVNVSTFQRMGLAPWDAFVSAASKNTYNKKITHASVASASSNPVPVYVL